MCIPTDSLGVPMKPTTTGRMPIHHKSSLNRIGSSNSGRFGAVRKNNEVSKSVSFGMVESKTYETIKGHYKMDAVYPLSLGWKCVEQSEAISVDQYEMDRPSIDRRTPEELLTFPKERRKMIKESVKRQNNSLNGDKTTNNSSNRKHGRLMKLLVLPTKVLTGRA